MLIALSQADWLEVKLDGYFILFFFSYSSMGEREGGKKEKDR